MTSQYQETQRMMTQVVDVAVDQNGMIIAAEEGQSKIYVINPADGKIMNTITCKQNINMHGVLSSGHIIAQPSPTRSQSVLSSTDRVLKGKSPTVVSS